MRMGAVDKRRGDAGWPCGTATASGGEQKTEADGHGRGWRDVTPGLCQAAPSRRRSSDMMSPGVPWLAGCTGSEHTRRSARHQVSVKYLHHTRPVSARPPGQCVAEAELKSAHRVSLDCCSAGAAAHARRRPRTAPARILADRDLVRTRAAPASRATTTTTTTTTSLAPPQPFLASCASLPCCAAAVLPVLSWTPRFYLPCLAAPAAMCDDIFFCMSPAPARFLPRLACQA